MDEEAKKGRHERLIDWVAVSIIFILIFMCGYVGYKALNPESLPEGTSSDALDASFHWAKAFITTIGGIAIGFLTKKKRDEHK